MTHSFWFATLFFLMLGVCSCNCFAWNLPTMTEVDPSIYVDEPGDLISETQENKELNREYIQGTENDVVIPDTSKSLKVYGIRDIFGIASIIFVSIAVVVLWIKHTLDERKSPLSQWKH